MRWKAAGKLALNSAGPGGTKASMGRSTDPRPERRAPQAAGRGSAPERHGASPHAVSGPGSSGPAGCISPPPRWVSDAGKQSATQCAADMAPKAASHCPVAGPEQARECPRAAAVVREASRRSASCARAAAASLGNAGRLLSEGLVSAPWRQAKPRTEAALTADTQVVVEKVHRPGQVHGAR